MAILLSCRELTKAFGLRTLFKGITLGLFEGERTGLIGPNGSGKSTLLRILAGLEQADSGELTFRRQVRVGYVAQEDALDGNGQAHEYAELAQWERAREATTTPVMADPAPRKAATPRRSRATTSIPGLTWDEIVELQEMEERITSAEAEVEAYHKQVADPAVIADHVRLRELCDRLHEVQAHVNALYARWAELEAKREA